MLKNYLTIAIRNILRHKAYSFINIAGLAIGVAACITIVLYVQQELSYDRYHSKADRIYRVSLHAKLGGYEASLALTAPPMAQVMREEIPEVETAARLSLSGGYTVIRYGDKVFSETRLVLADPNIFDVFDIPFLLGDPKTALTGPNNMVITASTAERYFGNENPIGKIMTSDQENERMITGVIEDFPYNSHFHYDLLLSMITDPDYANSQIWANNSLYTYIVLREGVSPADVEAKIVDMIDKYVGPQFEQALGLSLDQMAEDGSVYQLYLQPLTDIHLRSHLEREIEVNGNITYVYVFSIIAVFIMLIACINFMNLATARSMNRTREGEVGIRKVLGSTRMQLVCKFLVESITLTFIAVILAVILVESALPWLNNVLGLQLGFRYANLPWIVIGTVFVGILAGSYPAFFLSASTPAMVLRGALTRGIKGSRLRHGLVVLQFTITIVLITSTLIVRNQLAYLQDKNPGYNPNNLLIVEKVSDLGPQVQAFMQELQLNPAILAMSNSVTIPGVPPSSKSLLGMNTPVGEQQKILAIYYTDFNFADTYGLQVSEGRFFSSEFPSDSNSVVINQAAARAFGIDEPVGEYIIAYGGPENQGMRVHIIGVVENFHFESLHASIMPMVIAPFGIRIFGDMGPTFGDYLTLRIQSEDIPATLASIEETWRSFAVDHAFEYNFLENALRTLYITEFRTRAIASMFVLLAIFIACLGLLGLTALAAERRTKEIGIRKVLGASVGQIVGLLCKEFVVLVLIANVIAWPVAWYAMNRWLEDFAYRIDLGLGTFLLAGILALAIALATVSWQAIKAATANPVESLRYE